MILNSYHEGYPWTDEIMAGIRETLGAQEGAFRIDVEYMDAKRYGTPAYNALLDNLLRYKLKNHPFDLVMVSDNFAYVYALRHRRELFPTVPVVFCGVNDFHPEDLEGMPRVTGVAETLAFRETIELALRNHPEARQIVAIGSDRTPTEAASRQKLLALTSGFPQQAFLFWDNPSMDTLARKLGGLDRNTILLLYGFVSDEAGIYLPTDEACRKIRAASPAPLYSFWDFYLGQGIVGGNLVSGRRQGRLAARLALRILNGEDAGTIPVIRSDSNRYMFDHAELERFNIAENRLPPDSLVINHPSPYYALNKRHLILGLIIIAALGTVVAVLAWLLVGRSRMVKTLGRQAQMIDQVHEAVITTDLECRVQSWNPGAERLFGFSAAEMEGKAVTLLAPPQEEPLIRQNITETLKDGRIWKGEIHFSGKDGRSGICETLITPVLDDKGRPMAGIGVSRDVTENKALQRQLQQAQKMEIIGTLAGGIAHDFNNILASVLNCAEMALADAPPASPLRELLEVVIRAANRGKDLVARLLTFSRREAKGQKPVDVGKVLQESLQLVRASLPTTIEIRQEIAPDAGLVSADPTQIHQIILNLCTNAFYAMGEEGGVLELKLHPTRLGGVEASDLKVAPGPYLQLVVRDSGCGMDADTRARIFDPFFSTRKGKGGTGLGLAVVRNIVRGSRGAIRVTSEVGKGAVFTVFLPLLENSAAELEQEEESGHVPGGHERILLVDDDRELVATWEKLFTSFGYEVTATWQARQALELFRGNPAGFDLVISDYTMPGLTGLQLAEELLRIRPDLPVILCTGYRDSCNPEKIRALGIRRVVGKPVGRQELAEIVRQVLDGSPAKGPPGTTAGRLPAGREPTADKPQKGE
jgi:PAS domain S-box-containing protein